MHIFGWDKTPISTVSFLIQAEISGSYKSTHHCRSFHVKAQKIFWIFLFFLAIAKTAFFFFLLQSACQLQIENCALTSLDRK
jgi:hypothetical protein